MKDYAGTFLVGLALSLLFGLPTGIIFITIDALVVYYGRDDHEAGIG